jgi:phosphatidate cytidylyltransferase
MTRVLSGAVLIVLVVAIVWFAPPVVFETFAVAVGVAGTWELGRLMGGRVPLTLGFAAVYLAAPLAALVGVRLMGGPQALFLLMLTVMISDTAQYYTGRSLGRTPLAPRISPKKTIEGAVGGFVVGTTAFVVLGAWWAPQIAVAARIALGLAIVALGIAGDLFESMLKRRAGVKDSSALIPGHGGVLDRIDALLFAAPVYYIALRYL